MKKFINVLFVFVLCTSCVIAKEKLTPDEMVNKKCYPWVEYAEKHQSIDNTILMTECYFKQNKKYGLDNISTSKKLIALYSQKYNSSLNDDLYLRKIYKYSIEAIKAGSCDVALLENALAMAIEKKNSYDIDFLYSKYHEIAPAKAEKIRKSLLLVKDKIEAERSQNITNALNNKNVQNLIEILAVGCTWDKLTNSCMYPSQIEARNQALLKQGTSYEQLLMQKRQQEESKQQLDNLRWELQNVNSNLNSIDSNLNGLRWGY